MCDEEHLVRLAVVEGFAYDRRHVVRTSVCVDNAVGPQVLPRFPTVLGSIVPQPLDKEFQLRTRRAFETFGHVVNDGFDVELTNVRGGHFLRISDGGIIVKRPEPAGVDVFHDVCGQIADNIVRSF